MTQDAAENMKAGVDAFEQTVLATLELGAALGAAEWAMPTECPGWSVQDNVSHIVDIERRLLDDPPPAHALPADRPHVRNALGERNEVGVHARRHWPPVDVLHELDEVLTRRLTSLRDGSIDPHRETETPFGRSMPYGSFMPVRAFDCWAHEQDIRRATGRPGNLDSAAAQCARGILRGALAYVVGKAAGAEPGQSVTFQVGAPLPFVDRVVVDPHGRAHVTEDDAASTVTLGMAWQTFARLGCGRCGADDVSVRVAGSRDLGRRVLEGMRTTP